MTLWIILTLMCCAATVALTVPLVRRYEMGETARDDATAIYVSQLTELKEEHARDDLSDEEFKAAKSEISRRLLIAEKATGSASSLGQAWKSVALVSVVVLVVGGGIAIYRTDGQPGLVAPARVATSGQSVASSAQNTSLATVVSPATTSTQSGSRKVGDVSDMIDSLAQRLAKTPADAEGWRMLGWSYFSTQRYVESAQAYARAAALKPEVADYKSSHAEALIQAARGEVSPEAKSLIEAALAIDAKDARARFYQALATEQAGQLPKALAMWSSLLSDAPAGAGWASDVRSRITDLGKKTGQDVSAALSVNSPTDLTAPSASMSDGEKQSMIDGMVAGLAARLETAPMDPDGWAMLIRSYMIQGRADAAAAALARAKSVFANAPVVQRNLAGLAQQLGVPSSGGAPAVPGVAAPDEEQAAAIRALPAQDQQAMIVAMVDRLADKLKSNPKNPDGWLKLIRSRLVLKQPDRAAAALANALEALQGDAEAQERVRTGAAKLGVKAP